MAGYNEILGHENIIKQLKNAISGYLTLIKVFISKKNPTIAVLSYSDST